MNILKSKLTSIQMMNIITTALIFTFSLVLKNDNTHFWKKNIVK